MIVLRFISPRVGLAALGARISWLILCVALAAGGCATAPRAPLPDAPVARAVTPDPALAQRILALDPERVSDSDVRSTLAAGPTPRIVLLHGGVYPVHLLMESFAKFLVGMGYPRERIRDSGDGALSRSPYDSSEREAGAIAWYYEQEGVRPLMVGHSQGGIQAVKILHQLAGAFSSELRPYNPLTQRFEDRTTIVDPLTGRERPVVGVSVAYASVVGAGGWSLVLPNHWMVATRIRSIPDTVDEFTGYRIAIDFFAFDAPGFEGLKTFSAMGKANVRNVTLPAEYSHVFVPGTARLAEDPAMRDWINAFDPKRPDAAAAKPEGNAENVLWAADVWHSIKRHWTLEAQRFIHARRAAPAEK